MSMFSAMKTRVFGTDRLKKRVFDPEKMDINDIELPKALAEADIDDIREKVKEEIDTYKSLDYVNLPLDQLKFPEYHCYQVGILLRFLKEDRVFLIPNIEAVLPSAALHMTKKQLHIKVFDLVYRYNEYVDKGLSIDELKAETKWSSLEMAYLLRYASMEDRKIAKKS